MALLLYYRRGTLYAFQTDATALDLDVNLRSLSVSFK